MLRHLSGVVRFGVRLALFGLVLAGAAFAQPVAVLLDSGAGASVKRVTGVTPARLLQTLVPADELQLPAQSRAVMLFLRTGDEYSVEGPAAVRIGADAPVAVSGAAPVRRTVAPGREVRVRPERLAQGGLVLRVIPPPPPPPTVAPDVIERRRPPAGAPLAERVAFALWLEEVDAVVEAKAVWRALAAERPDEPALAVRAR